MPIWVKFLAKDEIERRADALLDAYRRERGRALRPPIPVDDILETHLGLSLDFDDLARLLGAPDVLGALWVDRREVYIDQSLDPVAHPRHEGRFNFSVGHEIGHWVLHRHYLARDRAPHDSRRVADPPSVICRSSGARAPIEVQAGLFATFLLMPARMIRARFHPSRYRSLTFAEFVDYVLPQLAGEFGVSRSAMRYRLRAMGLLGEHRAPDPALAVEA